MKMQQGCWLKNIKKQYRAARPVKVQCQALVIEKGILEEAT